MIRQDWLDVLEDRELTPEELNEALVEIVTVINDLCGAFMALEARIDRFEEAQLEKEAV